MMGNLMISRAWSSFSLRQKILVSTWGSLIVGLILPGVVRALTPGGNADNLPVKSMASAVDQLVSRYGYAITLEEPRLTYEGDLEDMPAQYRNDLGKYPHGEAPRVLVPRSNALTLKVPAATAVSAGELGSVLQQLTQTQSTSDHGAHFRLQHTGNVFHIIPTEVRDHSGNWTPLTPIFDAPITIQSAERSALDTVNAICTAVGANAHVPVKLLWAPMTTLRNSRETFEANNEQARSVMTRALSGLAARLTWRVGYFGEMSSYLLVITVVPDKRSPASGAAENATTPALPKASGPGQGNSSGPSVPTPAK
jgi:hypothetical protein